MHPRIALLNGAHRSSRHRSSPRPTAPTTSTQLHSTVNTDIRDGRRQELTKVPKPRARSRRFDCTVSVVPHHFATLSLPCKPCSVQITDKNDQLEHDFTCDSVLRTGCITMFRMHHKVMTFINSLFNFTAMIRTSSQSRPSLIDPGHIFLQTCSSALLH